MIEERRDHPDTKPSLIFSVDVEDWGQSTLDNSLPIGPQCALNTRRMLEFLEGWPGARATFFVLGLFAERHPAVVRGVGAASRAGQERRHLTLGRRW